MANLKQDQVTVVIVITAIAFITLGYFIGISNPPVP